MPGELHNRLLVELALVEEEDEAARIRADAERLQALERLLKELEADRAAQLRNIDELDRLLKISEADRAARLLIINELDRLLKDSEADRAARLVTIHELERLLQESKVDRAARLARVCFLGRIVAWTVRPVALDRLTFDRWIAWSCSESRALARRVAARLR